MPRFVPGHRVRANCIKLDIARCVHKEDHSESDNAHLLCGAACDGHQRESIARRRLAVLLAAASHISILI
ncbi:hypothetical protein PMIN01_03786 [Paraphaeosphaeria minitans]|uniref:Uncharacterized protein n=1 Tax=Paraphaeosphaeria minitans TaxID=565426 RepID=A0A9P6KT53_9PLEO|nr:hypothetical protein PMIN01_03786 [Paraphaeosphaeria minitans]